MSRILITGASKGIGRAVAVELAARGHDVVATARDAGTLADLDVADRLALDVTDQASVDAAVAAAGPVDTLVSNAGVIFLAPVELIPGDEFARILASNTVGATRVASALLPGLRERGGGRLLFMSSVAGRVVLPGNAAYAATKWALEAIGESLAIEGAPFGIDVGLLEPGAVDSGALDAPLTYASEADPYWAGIQQLRAGLRDGEMLSPQDVARATADAVEADAIPLRIPIGTMSATVLAARKQAPETEAFVVGGGA